MRNIASAIIITLIAATTVSFAEARPNRWAGNQQDTYGWQLMSADERAEHQAKLRSFKDYESCKTYVAEHHKKMEERAREKGASTPTPRRNPCDIMKSRGMLK